MAVRQHVPLYKYKATGKLYTVICEGEMKDTYTRLWVDSVTYQSVDTLKKYTRPQSEFKQDWELVASIPVP